MSYYKKEFDRLEPKTSTIVLKDEKNNTTRTLTLNQECATELMQWIEDNFTKLKKE